MSKKVVFIIAQNGWRDEELLKTKELLEDREFEVFVAAPKKEKAKGKLGAEIEPDLAWADIEVESFEAIIFIGGPGIKEHFEDNIALSLARKFSMAGKIIAAICAAPSLLANAGLLMGKRVTAFPSEEENLVNKGAEYTGMPIEVDGKIITAKDHTNAIDFGEKIAWELGEG